MADGQGSYGAPVASLAHHEGDDVAVAVSDVAPSEHEVACFDSGQRRLSEAGAIGHREFVVTKSYRSA